MLEERLSRIRRFNLNKKIVALTLGVFMLIFALCFIGIALVFLYQEEQISEEMLLDVYDRIDTRLDGYVQEIDMASNTVMCSKWVQQLLSKNVLTSEADLYEYRTNVSHFLSSFSSIYGEIKSFVLLKDRSYVKNNNSYYPLLNFDIYDQDWYKEIEESGEYREYGNSSILDEKNGNSMTIYYEIRNIYNFEPMGFFIINVDYGKFKFVQEMINEDEYILIRDQAGNTIYSNLGNLIENLEEFEIDYGETKGNGRLKIYYDQTMNGSWDIWILKENTILEEVIKNNKYIFLIVIPVALLFMAVSLFLCRYMTKPIVLCTQALREVRNQNYDVKIPNGYKDEIGDMIEGFNDMSFSIKSLIEQNLLMYKARQQAEITILQQKMDPHFLCNTLEIINGMILSGDEDKAVELGGMLGTMYRYDLGEDDIVTIREELSYLKNYLAIISYKFRDFEVEYAVDEDVLDCSTSKFICQPLVENSIKHGFCNRLNNCRIRIEIRRREGKLFLRIDDNGAGIPEILLSELQGKLLMLKQDQAIEIDGYVGLLNTARRIFLRYGQEAEFDITSRVEEGTRIEIQIPAME